MKPRILALGLGILLLAACSGGGGDSGLSPEAEAGRKVYVSYCTACHAMDPNHDGNLGPAVAGSSRELVEARVVHGSYPPGYTPKRSTSAMVALPHLEGDIDALTAYLNEAAK